MNRLQQIECRLARQRAAAESAEKQAKPRALRPNEKAARNAARDTHYNRTKRGRSNRTVNAEAHVLRHVRAQRAAEARYWNSPEGRAERARLDAMELPVSVIMNFPTNDLREVATEIVDRAIDTADRGVWLATFGLRRCEDADAVRVFREALNAFTEDANWFRVKRAEVKHWRANDPLVIAAHGKSDAADPVYKGPKAHECEILLGTRVDGSRVYGNETVHTRAKRLARERAVRRARGLEETPNTDVPMMDVSAMVDVEAADKAALPTWIT